MNSTALRIIISRGLQVYNANQADGIREETEFDAQQTLAVSSSRLLCVIYRRHIDLFKNMHTMTPSSVMQFQYFHSGRLYNQSLFLWQFIFMALGSRKRPHGTKIVLRFWSQWTAASYGGMRESNCACAVVTWRSEEQNFWGELRDLYINHLELLIPARFEPRTHSAEALRSFVWAVLGQSMCGRYFKGLKTVKQDNKSDWLYRLLRPVFKFSSPSPSLPVCILSMCELVPLFCSTNVLTVHPQLGCRHVQEGRRMFCRLMNFNPSFVIPSLSYLYFPILLSQCY